MNVTTNNDEKSAVALIELKEVIDPEIGLNVVDLGLIYDLQFIDNENKIICTMTLTTEYCPMGESIVQGVGQAIQSAFGKTIVEVILTFQPPWDAEMISEEGREFLGR